MRSQRLHETRALFDSFPFHFDKSPAWLSTRHSGEARIDSRVATKDPQLVQIDHTPGAGGIKLVETMYPLVAEGIAHGLYLPNRGSILCGYCAYRQQCQDEYGGTVQ
jgi:hypothetical protein